MPTHPASLPSASEPSAEQRAFDDLARHVAHHVGTRPDPAEPARVPRVLADLPALPARYWQGRRAPPAPVRDELPVPTVHTTRAQSKQVTREARRVERLTPCTAPDTPALAVSTLAQRYRMPLEQPYEAHALRPQRVRLRAKLAKRCATCTHLLVRPELRTSSSQYKLRRLARAYVPALHLARRTDDGVHVTLTNPLMDAVRVELASPHATFSTTHVSLAGAADAWDVPAPPVPPGTDVWACGAHVHEHTATLGARRAAGAPADAPVAVRVQWTVGVRTHAFWAMLPM